MQNEHVMVIAYPSEESEKAELLEVKDDFREFQKIVGGTFSIPFISEKLLEKKIDIYVNDEGKIEGLEPSILIIKDNEILDYIVGKCVFTSTDSEGNTVSLNKDQVLYLQKNVFANCRLVKFKGKDPKVFPCIEF